MVVNRKSYIAILVTTLAAITLSIPFLMFTTSAYSFVLVSGREEAKLDLSITNPELIFQVSYQPPQIESAEKFLDQLNLENPPDPNDDAAIWKLILQESMRLWNEVEHSYAKLTFQSVDSVVISADDEIHSIGFAETNINTAAFARPRFRDGIIYDCDISVSNRVSKAENLAYTLTHELGHCLGLGHAHSDRDALMGYTRSDRSLRLGADDRAGLIYLYPDSNTQQKAQDLLLSCGSIKGAYGKRGLPFTLVIFLLSPFGLLYIKKRFHGAV